MHGLLLMFVFLLHCLYNRNGAMAVPARGQISSLMIIQEEVRLDEALLASSSRHLVTVENPRGVAFACTLRCLREAGCTVVSVPQDATSCTLGFHLSVCQSGTVISALGWTTYFTSLCGYHNSIS